MHVSKLCFPPKKRKKETFYFSQLIYNCKDKQKLVPQYLRQQLGAQGRGESSSPRRKAGHLFTCSFCIKLSAYCIPVRHSPCPQRDGSLGQCSQPWLQLTIAWGALESARASRSSKSESRGVGPRQQYFLNIPKGVQCVAKQRASDLLGSAGER